MNLYRIAGKHARFKNCGLLMVDPIYDTSHTKINKKLKELIKALDEKQFPYKLRIELVDIKTSINTKDVIELFTVGCPSTLIEKVTVITTKENTHELP